MYLLNSNESVFDVLLVPSNTIQRYFKHSLAQRPLLDTALILFDVGSIELWHTMEPVAQRRHALAPMALADNQDDQIGGHDHPGLRDGTM